MTEKVLYCVSRQPEWIDCARLVRDALDWHPAYWVTLPENHDAVRDAFPQCVTHEFLDLNRGLAARGREDWFVGGLDATDLERIAPFEPSALDMLDRVDLGGSLTHRQRQRLFHSLVVHWLNATEDLGLEVAVFNVPPHSIGEYAAYATFRARGLRTRLFRPTPVHNVHFVVDSIEELPPGLQQAYERRLDNPGLPVPTAVENHCSRLRLAQAGYRPWYLEALAEREDRSRRTTDRIVQALDDGTLVPSPLKLGRPLMSRSGWRERNLLGRRPKPGLERPVRQAFIVPGRSLHGPPMTKWELVTYRDWAAMQKVLLQRQYETLAEAVDLSATFVYFALHYEPERTTCPDGGRFGDQLLAISLLADCLPSDWMLYVKEHPSQFGFHGFGELSRSPGFYDALSSIPRVRVVPLDTPSLELVDASAAVATITGAVGWEALNRDRPVLYFGAAWYGQCRGAFVIRQRSDIDAAFAALGQGLRPTARDTVAYAAALWDIGATARTNPSLLPAEQEGDEDLGRVLSDLLIEFERRVDASRA